MSTYMLSYWKTEEIFMDGDEYFDRMIQDILLAKEYITIEMYMFNDDLLGKKIAAALIQAHQRGVKVQIMVDGVGSYEFFKKLYGIFKKKGIFIKMFNPLPFLHPYLGKVGFLRRFQLWGSRMVRLNKRNHRKIITLDQNVMYVGSFNFSADHTKLSLRKPWKDMGARVTGPNVKFAVLNFKRVWKLRDYYRYKKQFQETGVFHWKNSPLRLNQNLIRKRYFQKDILNRIESSTSHIWLATPYFIPRRKLIRALGRAAKRGVDVKILISHRSDIIFFRTLQFFYYPYLLKKGVKVVEYKETILHEKSFIIDDWVTVGTSNLNHRSLLHDLEVDLVVEDEKNRSMICDDFVRSCEGQMVIDEESLSHRNFQDKILGRLFFLFKYWF
jgi:cardiolipin synthase